VPVPQRAHARALALRDGEKAVEYDAKLGEAHLILARLLALPGGDRERGLKAAERAVELFADDKRQRSQALLARASLRTDVAQREADIEAAIQADPTNSETRRMRGAYYLTQKKYDKAIADFKKILEDNPEDMAALQGVAQALTSMKKYDEAAAQLSRMIELQPESPGGYLLRARLNQLREDTEATLDDLKKILELDEGNVFARMMRARIYLGQQKLDLAKADVERILERNSRLAEAILLRSLIFANEGNYAAAITDLKQIALAAPDNLAVRGQLAALYAADERPRKAIEMYDEILAVDEQNFQALMGRGDARLAIGEHAAAIADYEAAIKLDAENYSLLNNFSWVLSTSPVDELRNAQRAIELGTKACELTEYKLPHILSTLAAGYAEAGDFETARKWSAKAVELGEGDIKEQLQEELDSYKAEKPWRELKQTEEQPEPEPPSEDDLFID
jgi:tetratricopeptide (TPR) repeat protein